MLQPGNHNAAFIEAIEYHLPEGQLTNEIIEQEHPEWGAAKISAKTGIRNRHITAEGEFASDLALAAANKLFAATGIDKSEIGFLLYCTQSPDYFLPTTACILQHQLGLPQSVGALDFNLGCSGYVYGLLLAKGILQCNPGKKVLLITAETYSKFIHANDKSNKTIFGDAAAATLLGTTPGGFALGEFVYGSDGSGFDRLIVKNGGMRHRNVQGADKLDDAGAFVANDDSLYMDGPEIFSFTSKKVPLLVNETLERNCMAFDQVDYFLFHQANKFMLDFIRKKASIPAEKFIYHLENVGNTVSNTIPIALKEHWQQLLGKQVLLAGFGVGYSWAGCVIK